MADIDRHIARLKARNYQWPIPWEAVERMARFEDCRLSSYKCPSGVWTIGWGETEDIKPGMRWTEDQVDARYYTELVKYARKVEAMCTVDPTPNQLGALCMLAYNIGLRRDKPTKAGLYHSSILRLHNAGDFDGAARAFHLYNQGRDPQTKQLVVMRGLVTRRAWEAALYLKPEDDEPLERMPQAIAPESSLAASPIVHGGAITASTGALAGAVEIASTIQEQAGPLATIKAALATVKDFVHGAANFIGVPPGVLLAIALVAAGVIVMQQRSKQRREGWA